MKKTSAGLSLLILIVIATTTIFFFNDGKHSNQNLDNTSAHAINMAINYYPTALLFILADELNLYEKMGVNVNITQFEAYSEQLQAIENGQADATGLVLIDTFSQIPEDIPFKIVTILDYSYGADGILARGLSSVEDLEGTRIAVEKNTVGEFFLSTVLDRFNIDRNTIELVNKTASEAAKAFTEGSVDAAVTYEPHLSRALFSSDGEILIDSSYERGLIPTVAIVREDKLKEHPEAYEAFFKAWFKTVEFLEENPDESFQIIGDYLGISAEEVSLQFEGLHILDLRENINAFAVSSGFDSIYGSGRLTEDFLEKNKVLEDVPSLDSLIDDSIIKALKQN